MNFKENEKILLKEKIIIINKIQTPDGSILTSKYKKDIKYQDENGFDYIIGGGTKFLRRVSKNKDYKELSIFNTDHIKKIRDFFEWGTYGKDGNEPLKYIKLKDMEEEHIQNILKTQKNINENTISIFLREIEYRKYLKKIFENKINSKISNTETKEISFY